ncbi:MAG: cysteine rich repeat-containing protein [Methylovirgula sp.]
MNYVNAIAVGALIIVASVASAAAQTGPVATACKKDIPKFCAGKSHGQGEVRRCLQSHYAKVSAGCKHALDTTGGGKGMGK